MSLKSVLVAITLVAVISDYLLHPFYPHFFEMRFGVADPKQVGFYFSAICFVVMIAFPLWAQVSKKVPELRILVYTQFAAGILGIGCFFVTSYTLFWALSLCMIAFKGSYLLVYPYILKITSKENHVNTIGLLSVIVHFGSVAGAVLGGMVLEFIHPAYIFLVMATGDFIQMGASLYLLKRERPTLSADDDSNAGPTKATGGFKGFVLKIGVITLILYSSDFIIRPFFVRYWESLSIYDSKIISGLVYAIPALVALIALWSNRRRKGSRGLYDGIITAMLLGLAGLMLQGYPSAIVVFLGRLVYGWGIFQAMVRFDALLFGLSTPGSYATDYSKIHFFQNLGVLLASFSSGLLIGKYSLQSPFLVAITGFTLCISLYYFTIKARSMAPRPLTKITQ